MEDQLAHQNAALRREIAALKQQILVTENTPSLGVRKMNEKLQHVQQTIEEAEKEHRKAQQSKKDALSFFVTLVDDQSLRKHLEALKK